MKRLFFILLIIIQTLPLNAQWQKLNGPIKYYVLSISVFGSKIFAGTGLGEIFTSVDNGSNWVKSDSGLTLWSGINQFASNGSKIFVATNGSGVYSSTDDGTNWRLIIILNNFFFHATALSTNGQKIIVGNNFGEFFISNDNGVNWNNSKVLLNTGIYSLLIYGKNIFAGTYSDGIYISKDDGSTWSPIDSGLTNLAIHSLDSIGSNIIAGTDSGVFISSDTGRTWRHGIGLTNSYVHTLANNGILSFAATQNGVFVSADRGNSWTNINYGLTDLNVFSVACNNSYVFAGTYGYVWRRPMSEMPQGLKENSIGECDFLIFPNPTSNELNIQTVSNEKYFVQLFDVTGKLVVDHASGGTFSQNIILNLSEQPQGIYFLKIKDENNKLMKTQKVVVIK